MKTGQRGILLGGWAEMSAAVLEGEEDSEKLLAYCKDSNAEGFCLRNGIMPQRSEPDSTPNCLVFTVGSNLLPGMPSIIHHPSSISESNSQISGRTMSFLWTRRLMVFYFHDAKLLSITATWRMMECCPRLVVGCPVAVATRHGCQQMWRLICVKNSWDAWGVINISSRNLTHLLYVDICLHAFQNLSSLLVFYFPEPVLKIQGGAGTLNASALSGIPTVTGRDNELMVFEKNGWWTIKDSDVILTWFKNLWYMYHREFIYRCFDHFWWTLDTLRHLLVHSIIDNWQVFREWSVTHSLQSLCLLVFNEISNSMEPYGTPNGPTNVWCLSNSRQKRHEFGKMSLAQVIVPIFLDQFYHSDLVNVAWSGLGVSPGFPARCVFFDAGCEPGVFGKNANHYQEVQLLKSGCSRGWYTPENRCI